MIAAIYARKSTDQTGVAGDMKSVTRQIEHAKGYARSKGWTVPDNCIFVDDGISGAEFANRPGFVRLMAALKPRPPFEALIMSEESRLGREAIETAFALKQLVQAGVEVWFYLEDRQRTFDSPTDKLLMSVTAFADELEREKARQRTYDAMQRKARAGHVTGGRVFGYDNLEVLGADGRRSHVERRINDADAAVVRRIFQLCADGYGLTRITKALNADRCPAPRAQQGRPNAWTGSTVREVLQRELYRGVIVWNQTVNATAGVSIGSTHGRRANGCGFRRRICGSCPMTYGRRRVPGSRSASGSTQVQHGGGASTSTRSTCSPDLLAAACAVAGWLRTAGSTAGSACTSMAARHSGSAAWQSAETTWSPAWMHSTPKCSPR
jgi:DNA invertase Pin-like site-specific DNA recombinase